jgi:hypothetical protein
MKIRAVEAELLHADRRTDGRTDMTKLVVAFCNFAKAPKEKTDDGNKRRSCSTTGIRSLA